MTHTPGPWRSLYAYGMEGKAYFVVSQDNVDANGVPIRNIRQRICYSGDSETERRSDNQLIADAHLIAAAPETKEQRDELLDACESLVRRMEATFDFFPETCDGVSSMIVEDAKTAIAKAKGES